MERQQEISYQLDLFVEQKQNDIRSSDHRKDVNQAKARKAVQVNKEGQQGRALTGNLMAIICSSSNLKQAYKQVKRNKGVAGIDQMPTEKFADWFKENGETLINELLQGRFKPQAVKQVEIPKPKGGTRQLGIPTVTDRIIQQSIARVLSPVYEREFSNYSYGFRPKRRAIEALQQASEYVKQGRDIVLDELDKELEKRGHCFVRYADDFSIYVRSQKAGERVKKSISRFITNKLKLKVNEQKSVVCEVDKTVLLEAIPF